MAVPKKKLIRRKIRLPLDVTAASSSVPRKWPTIHASAVLYSCWNSWLIKIGRAKETMTFSGRPSVMRMVTDLLIRFLSDQF